MVRISGPCLQFHKAEATKLTVQAASKSIKLPLSLAQPPLLLALRGTFVDMKSAILLAA